MAAETTTAADLMIAIATAETELGEVNAQLVTLVKALSEGRIGGPAVDAKLAELRLRSDKLVAARDTARLQLAALGPAQCPSCRMGELVVSAEVWGNSVDCTVCNHHEFRPIGD